LPATRQYVSSTRHDRLVFLLASAQEAHPWLEFSGKVLVVIGIALFLVEVWRHWKEGINGSATERLR
jgi:hypothetical protein